MEKEKKKKINKIKKIKNKSNEKNKKKEKKKKSMDSFYNVFFLFMFSLGGHKLAFLHVHHLSLVLQKHTVLGRQTDTSLHDVLNTVPLTEKSIHNGGTGGNKRSLQHEREQRHHRVEALEFFHLALDAVLDTTRKLSNENQIKHHRGSQKGILTGVVNDKSVLSTHENLGGVFIHGPLGVTDVREVLDDDNVVRLLSGLVKDLVGLDHVIDDVALGDLLGPELLGSRQVLSIVVTEMVVRGNGDGLDTRGHQPIDQDGLELGLTSLEIVTTNRDVAAEGHVQDTGNEGVLGGTVDVRAVLEDGSDGKEKRGGDLVFLTLNGGHQVLFSVVDTGQDVREPLGVGRPQDNDFFDTVVLLEVTDIGTDLLHHLLLGALEGVVGAGLLVGSDEIGEVDGGERDNLLHVGVQLSLEIVVEDTRALHSVTQVGVVDIPTTDLEGVRIGHGEEVGERNKHILAILVSTNTNSRGLCQGTNIIGGLLAFSGPPRDTFTVGDDTTGKGAPVVSTQTNNHNTDGGDFLGGTELKSSGLGFDGGGAITDSGGTVGVVVGGVDVSVGVLDIGAVDNKFLSQRHLFFSLQKVRYGTVLYKS